MLNAFHSVILILFIMPGVALAADADARRIDRMEERVGNLRKEKFANERAINATTRELKKARAALADAESRVTAFERSIPADRARSPQEEDQLSSLKRERARESAKVAEAEATLAELKAEKVALKDEVETKEDTIARAQDALEARQKKSDCPDGTCAGAKKGPPNQPAARSGWENFAEILKAVSPMAVAGMQTYLGTEAINKQSSDYRYYSANNKALGLPSAAPAPYGGFSSGAGIGYGISNVGSFGGYGATGGFTGWGGLGGFNGYGNFGGPGGFGGYNAYAGYGGFAGYGGYSSYGGYGGLSNSYYGVPAYGTSSAYSYANQFAATGSVSQAAQQRAWQQQQVVAGDSSIAQGSLYAAYSSYYQSFPGAGLTIPNGSHWNYNNVGTPGLNTLYSPSSGSVLTGSRE